MAEEDRRISLAGKVLRVGWVTPAGEYAEHLLQVRERADDAVVWTARRGVSRRRGHE